ncbi:MAG: hypothetical protein HKN87_19165 [Saprospiraceae bacterium]|nr:hypothetical protein [Saprospiraceae bacterium]
MGDSMYRTERYKLLIGHSFGGLFVLHTLVNHPGIFNSYLAIGPSLWWDDQRLVIHQMDSFLLNQKDLRGHVYMTMGNEGGSMLGGTWKFTALLEERGSKELLWKFDLMPDQTHGSVVHLSTYNGLEYIFKDWSFKANRDNFLSGGAIAVRAFNKRVDKFYALPSPIPSRNLVSIGKEILASGDDDEKLALGILQMAVEVDTTNQEAYNNYGEFLLRHGHYHKAIRIFQRSYRLDSTNLTTLIHLKNLGVNIDNHLPDIPFSKQLYDEHIGTYIMNVEAVQLTVDEQKLWVEEGPATQGLELELFPIGIDQFYHMKDKVKITFRRENGEIDGLDVEIDGQIIRASKRKP